MPNLKSAEKTVIHAPVDRTIAAGKEARNIGIQAKQGAHKPSYNRKGDPEEAERGIIGGGSGWRARKSSERRGDAAGSDRSGSLSDAETAVGSDRGEHHGHEEDFDFPSTYTTKKQDKEGNEVIVLNCKEGDPEDPHNWSKGYKW